MWSDSARSLAQELLELQTQRVKQYKVLGDAHKAYLSSGPDWDLSSFKVVVSEVTREFSEISKKMIAMKDAFREIHSDQEMAGYIGTLQEQEERKLKATVDHQLAAEQALTFPDDELMQKNNEALKKLLDSIVEQINDTLEEIRYHIHEKENLDR